VLTKDLSEVTVYQDALKLTEVKELNAAGKFKEAHKVYKSISSTSKVTKAFQLINIMTTFNLSEDLYYKAIKDYEKRFPNDPSLYLVSLDGLIFKKEFDKAIKSIDKLDELLGGDPFLNYIKGNIYYYEKEYESALGKYAIVNLEYPDFIDAYDSALGIYLETNNNEKVIEILELYVTKFEMDKEELKFNLSEFAPAFIKTKEFKNWFSK
jgi:tetratricopeptide (TPR) repeat protein